MEFDINTKIWHRLYTRDEVEIEKKIGSVVAGLTTLNNMSACKCVMGALKSRDLTRRHHVPFADFVFPVCYTLMSRKTTELYVKVFQRVQQLVPQFAPTCAMADFEEASVAGCFLDNRLCQITVQTFSIIIIATFPSANT